MSAQPDMTPGEIAQAGRNAPHGFGPWASEWTRSTARIVYDLASALEAASAELSALKATSPDGPTKEQAWAGYRAAQGAVIDAGFTGDVSPRDAIEALSARLAALEARRCDGCAHSNTEHYSKEGTWLVCLLADNEEGGSPAYVAVEDYPLVVSPSHSCAAWTEKP